MAFKFKNKFYKQSYIEFRLTTISRENEKITTMCCVFQSFVKQIYET